MRTLETRTPQTDPCRPLVLALAIVLLTTTADAAKLPPKFVGDWCRDGTY